MTTVGAGRYTFEVHEQWAVLPTGWTFGPVSAVATDSQDRVYAFQRKDPPVVVFDRHGTYLTSWGSGTITAEGRFIAQWRDIHRPTDIYISPEEIAYVSEIRPSVSILDKRGTVLARFDSPSGHGLWVDSAGDIYLASNSGRSLTKYIHKH